MRRRVDRDPGTALDFTADSTRMSLVSRSRAHIAASLVLVLVSVPLLPSDHVHATESPDGHWRSTVHAHSGAGEHCHHAHPDHAGSGAVLEQGAPESFESLDAAWVPPKRSWSRTTAAALMATIPLVIRAPRAIASLTYEAEHYIHGPPGLIADPRGPPSSHPAL
jgi:hypothetical protein